MSFVVAALSPPGSAKCKALIEQFHSILQVCARVRVTL